MFLKNYPNCCTAKVLTGFGQTLTADHAIRPQGNELPIDSIKSEIEADLKSIRLNGYAVLTCITNDQQVNGNQALEEMGFKSSGWMSKDAHPETKIKLWWHAVDTEEQGDEYIYTGEIISEVVGKVVGGAMTKEIKSWIKYCEENERLAYLMATTSNDQVAGAEALEAAGFICTHNVVNQKYPDTYLKTWMYFFNGEVTPEQLAEFGE